jgi:ankyrin repeat protein
MIDCGVDVNHVDNEGVTPLFYTVRSGVLPLVKLILSHGALVNHTDVKGVTAFKLCKMTNASKEIQDLLIKNGATKLEIQQ